MTQGRVLVIGGSDNSGAAGIQGDVKTATALGAYATSAVTCVTVQDASGILELMEVPARLIARQIETALADFGADAVKTGLLVSPEAVDAVVDVLEARGANLPLVVDAATTAFDGRVLASTEAVAALKRRLMVRARVLVASVRDATTLSGTAIETVEQMRHVVQMLRTIGAEAVILTDGNGPDDTIVDFVAGVYGEDERILSYPRPRGHRVRGVSGALATAIATFLGRGSDLVSAVQHARIYLTAAVGNAQGLGSRAVPINHSYATLFEPLQRG